jgi:hypothetical protein
MSAITTLCEPAETSAADPLRTLGIARIVLPWGKHHWTGSSPR